MRLYARTFRVVCAVTILTFIICVVIHYSHVSNYEIDFWMNVILSVFSGALLTSATSLIGYFCERRKTLEKFMTLSLNLIRKLLKYDTNWDIDVKIDYFISLIEDNRDEWHDSFGDIFFLFDPFKKRRNYVSWNLYKPMRDLFDKIGEHKRQFYRYKDVAKQISMLENEKDKAKKDIDALRVRESKLKPYVFSDIRDIESTLTHEWLYCTDSPVGTIHCTDNSSFARKYFNEFNGRYYDMMYGKKRRTEGE